jgi:hypothetical protein
MRTYGRISNSDGSKSWVKVETDTNGFNDMVYLTTLIQCLLLNLGESPFYANYGIPAKTSIIQQIMPDFYVAQTQQQFASYFASLTIANSSTNPPTYKINVTTHQGVKISASIPIPQ